MWEGILQLACDCDSSVLRNFMYTLQLAETSIRQRDRCFQQPGKTYRGTISKQITFYVKLIQREIYPKRKDQASPGVPA